MVIKVVYHFADSNLGVEISSKKGLMEKEEREEFLNFFFLPGRWVNDLPWGKKGLPGEPGVGGNYTYELQNEVHPRQLSKIFPTLYKYLPVTASRLLYHTNNTYFSRINFSLDHS